MSRKRSDLCVYDDFIERCDNISKKNFAKFHNYSKHQEVLRLQIIETSNDYKYLKTWLDTAYEEIISMKSQHGDLTRLYEALLNTNLVKEFLDFANIQEIFRLKFIETINKYQNMNRGLELVNKNITTIKSEYNNLNQPYKVSLEHNTAEEFSENSLRQLENLRLKLIKTIDESERLNGCLDVMIDGLARLNSEQDNSRRRYNELLENKLVKEFLDYAKYQEKLQLKFTEKSNECDCSKTCIDRANESIASLNSQLKEANKMLTSALLQREKIEIERDSFDYLSEELCRLLMRYLRLTLPKETREIFLANDESMMPNSNFNMDQKPFQIDYSNTNVESDSSSISEISISESKIEVKDIKLYDNIELDNQRVSYFDEKNKDPITVKIETPDELPATITTPSGKSLEFLTLHSTHDNVPVKKPDVMKSPPETSGKLDLVEELEAPGSSHQLKLRTRDIQKSHSLLETSIFECDICGESFRQKTSIVRHTHAHMAKKISPRRLSSSKLKPKSQKHFKCSFCDKRFTDPGNRRRHEREIHLREARHNCNFCDSQFRRKELLAYHLQAEHSSKKQFKCSKCGKTFAKKQHLKNHKSVHTSKRPYQCSQCDQRFKDRDSVRKHTRRVHEKDPDRYCCAECGKRYRCKRDVKKHILKIHL